ncbi:MAG: hypothetical protein Q9184_000890 [Pyrenodesmia sp. 2 TL-2023]
MHNHHTVIQSTLPPKSLHNHSTPERKKSKEAPTGWSIQALRLCSNATHPAAEYPDEAQQLSMLVMMPTHGFASAWLGRRTRSLGRGGRRGADGLMERGGMVFSGARECVRAVD